MCPQALVSFHDVEFHEPPRSRFQSVTCRQDEDANDRDNKRFLQIFLANVPLKNTIL